MNIQKQKVEIISIKGYIAVILFFSIFFLFGLAFIRVSIVENSFIKPCTSETMGTIGKVSHSSKRKRGSRHWYTLHRYEAYYTYEIQGEILEDKIVTSKKIKEGQTIVIRYNSDNPNEKYVKGYDDAGNLFILIIGIFWSVFSLCVMGIMIREIIRIKTEKIIKGDLLYFNSPFGKFWQSASDDFGFECDIDWNDENRKKTTVYVESDKAGMMQVEYCYKKFKRLYKNKRKLDDKARQIMAEYFIEHPQYLLENNKDINKFGLFISSEIYWVGIYRNGDVSYAIRSREVNADNIKIITKKSGRKEIQFLDLSEGGLRTDIL